MRIPFSLKVLATAITATMSGLAIADSPAATNKVEEITVTAQKREQSILDVPVTITAFSGKTLEEFGIDRFDELSDFVPGLVVQQQSINNNGYVIRGITSDDGASESAPRVSVYLNGADVSRSRASYFEVYDMERVEVVKGPQATLFGTAASIGAISFITNKPSQEFESEFRVGTGNFGMQEVGGFINGGNDLIQARLAFVVKERDGYVENNSDEGDLNGFDRTAFRPSIRITPNDSLTIDFVYNHEEADDPGTGFVNESLLYTDRAFLSVADDPILGATEVGIDRETDDYNLTVDWEVSDSASITYIGSHREYESLEPFDADGISLQFLSFAEEAFGDQSSHELRLNLKGNKLNGFVGLSYFEEDASQRIPFATEEGLFLSCAGALAAAGITGCDLNATATLTGGAVSSLNYASNALNSAENDSLSVFGDLSYAVTDKLEVTAGVRFVDESRESSYTSNVPDSVLLAGIGVQSNLFGGAVLNTDGETISDTSDNTAILPRLNVLYQINDTNNVYGTISMGERSEVLDVSSGAAVIAPAEEVINYEVGVKGTAADSKLSYSASLFYQDYENFQVNVFDQGSGRNLTENAGTATNIGVEADAKWALSDAITVLANIAYIDASIDDDESNGTYAGNRFRLQPEWTGAVGYMFNTAVTDEINLTSSGAWTYRSSTFFDIENRFEEDAVDLLNLRVGVAAQDDNWEVNVFGTNLLDEEYIMDGGNTGASFGLPTYIEGAPRMYGIEAVKRF